MPVNIEDKVRLPADLTTLEAFRRWARSEEFPERGQFAFLCGDVWVDLSMEDAFTHNRVKTRINGVLDEWTVSAGLGYYFSDGMLLSNVEVDLSTEPDGTFVSYDTLRSERLRLLEGQAGGYVELVGTPDMVLEVVSTTSVRKDTRVLRRLYWEAGIEEYWLVDARGPALRFDVLRRRRGGYATTRRQDGWVRSQVFGRSFHFSRQTDSLGHPQYTLASRP